LSFFLHKYSLIDVNGSPTAVNYQLIKKELKVGTTLAKNVAAHYQSLLSNLSCGFLFELLDNYFLKDGNNLLFKNLLKVTDRKKYVLPYYNATKILIHNAVASKIPIVLSIDRIHDKYTEMYVLLFKRNETTGEFTIQTDLEQYDSDAPCVVFRGCVNYQNSIFEPAEEYLKRLLAYSLEDILLMNAASHPQYAGEKLENYKLEPYKDLPAEVLKNPHQLEQVRKMDNELKTRKKLSLLRGFSLEHQGLFYVEHIFCSLIENETNRGMQKSIVASLKVSNMSNNRVLNFQNYRSKRDTHHVFYK
jgi:hypothetical protein